MLRGYDCGFNSTSCKTDETVCGLGYTSIGFILMNRTCFIHECWHWQLTIGSLQSMQPTGLCVSGTSFCGSPEQGRSVVYCMMHKCIMVKIEAKEKNVN